MAKRNFSKFQSLYNNNQLKQFYTIPYGTESVLFFTIFFLTLQSDFFFI